MAKAVELANSPRFQNCSLMSVYNSTATNSIDNNYVTCIPCTCNLPFLLIPLFVIKIVADSSVAAHFFRSWYLILAAVSAASLMEAFTGHIDNLVLPPFLCALLLLTWWLSNFNYLYLELCLEFSLGVRVASDGGWWVLDMLWDFHTSFILSFIIG